MIPLDPNDNSTEATDERADLWALWHGFTDAEESEEGIKLSEREKLAVLIFKRGAC